MSGFQQMLVVGNLGKDPISAGTGDGRYCRFSVAATTKFGKSEHTEWFNATVFGGLADTCQKYLHKGSKVQTVGRLESRKYVGKDGEEKIGTNYIVSGVTFLDPPKAREESSAPRDASAARPTPMSMDDLADIPF
jgi:single-strand DNA-binding protein